MKDTWNPDRGIVFDVETIPHPDMETNLGFHQKAEFAKKASAADLQMVVERDQVKVGNAKKVDKIREATIKHYEREVRKAGLTLYGSQVCAIGWTPIDSSSVTTFVVDPEDPERQEINVLSAFARMLLEEELPSVLCGFNIRGFDLSMIRVRCAFHGIYLPDWFPVDEKADRYDRRLIFDAQDILHQGPLDYWLRMFGLPLKSGSGARVKDLKPEELRGYLANDLECERQLVIRLSRNVPSLRALIPALQRLDP